MEKAMIVTCLSIGSISYCNGIWMKVRRICGPKKDSECIEYTGMYLEGVALRTH